MLNKFSLFDMLESIKSKYNEFTVVQVNKERNAFYSNNIYCILKSIVSCRRKVIIIQFTYNLIAEISLNETDLWSFPSITEISSKVMCMNTSQPIVEQAIVHSVSAVKEYVDYSSICEYITQELNLAAEQQWFCIAGDADSFEPYLQQFPSFISIFIKHINIFIFRTSFMSSEAADEENSLGVDRLPSVQIIYSQLNDSVIDFVRETSNFELSRCSFDYYCASANIRQQLNQYYGNEYGTKWQCIIIAADSSFAINVDQINSTFLELIFAKTHRIIVYKI